MIFDAMSLVWNCDGEYHDENASYYANEIEIDDETWIYYDHVVLSDVRASISFGGTSCEASNPQDW